MEKLSQEELDKAMRECVVSSFTYDPANPNGYSQDLFDVKNEDFAKEYEFMGECNIDDLVKHKESGAVFKVFYKQDDKVRLLRVSNAQAMSNFESYRGIMAKIIGFKPEDQE
ncbi:hypothetical protein YZ31_07620 [Campylobacter lari]|nr:hypothetical protein [Campylobacter lari]